MIDYRGLKLPDGETHLIEWMDRVKQYRDGKPTYQLSKYNAALAHVRHRGVAVDVGAHVGLWSRVMALDFERVIGFEPVPAHIECWRANLAGAENATLHEIALGDRRGTASLHTRTPGSCGDTSIARDSEPANAAHDVPMAMLDDFGLEVDFLKIDNEGYEYFVVLGGEETIRRCKPVVIVEQKPGMAQRFGLEETQAVSLLESWGARQVGCISGDYIVAW